MLILSRRPGEEIRIGDAITVTVLGIKGNQIRLGIKAPKNVIVDRAEVRARRDAEKGTPHEDAPALDAAVSELVTAAKRMRSPNVSLADLYALDAAIAKVEGRS